jgi:hypothetical protein
MYRKPFRPLTILIMLDAYPEPITKAQWFPEPETITNF